MLYILYTYAILGNYKNKEWHSKQSNCTTAASNFVMVGFLKDLFVFTAFSCQFPDFSIFYQDAFIMMFIFEQYLL